MKKYLLIMLAIIMSASVVSCSSKKETETAETTTQTQNDTSAGFLSGVSDPWEAVEREKIKEKCGYAFGEPAGAENVTYYWCEENGISEMQFLFSGIEWCARVQKVPVYEDISGMEYEWEQEVTTDVLPITGYLRTCRDGNSTAVSVLWQDDAATGEEYMLSLSCVTDKEYDLKFAGEVFTFHTAD